MGRTWFSLFDCRKWTLHTWVDPDFYASLRWFVKDYWTPTFEKDFETRMSSNTLFSKTKLQYL